MRVFRTVIFFTLLFALILLARCAVDVPPTGGPEDKTPPRVVAVFPDSGALRVQTNKLRVRFDKYIVTQSLRNALFFSPRIDDYEVESDGKEAEIILYEPLKPNRTYACTITKALTDTRGNSLAQSFTFAFSTGSTIDSGIISGVVYSAENRFIKGATVLAYFIPEAIRFLPIRSTPRTHRPTTSLKPTKKDDSNFHFSKTALIDFSPSWIKIKTCFLIQVSLSPFRLIRFIQAERMFACD